MVLTVAALLASGSLAFANHVRCGDVITRDTRLDSDLTGCPGDGIVIGANDITLDLAGHSIDGSADRNQAGIDNDAGHAGVTIEHGRVQGFEFGVRLVRASYGRLRELALSDNRFGITLTDSNSNVIAGNSSDGGTLGLELSQSHANRIAHNVLTGNGIALTSSNDNRIVENTLAGMTIVGDSSSNDLVARNSVSVSGSWRSGIYAVGSGHRIERNTITGSGLGSRGIDLHGAVNARVVRNSLSGHENGIFCISSPGGNLLERNVVRDNSGVGIVTIFCHRTRIERNHVSHNGGPGITLAASRDGYVARNLVAGNRHGITFQESSESRMERNIVVDSQELGIDSYHGSSNSILHNRVSGSGYAGVAVADDGDHVEQNVIYDNGNEGMRVLREDNHVQGNVMHDNGGPGLSFGAMKLRIEGNVLFANAHGGMRGFMFEGAISQNIVVGNRRDGIFFFESPTSAVISSNHVHRNSGDGIDMDATGARLSKNSANRNGDLGIEGVAGVIDGGDNKARRNGNPLQCVNVFCR
jgi:parallel beta-helix repeat protein